MKARTFLLLASSVVALFTVGLCLDPFCWVFVIVPLTLPLHPKLGGIDLPSLYLANSIH